MWRFRVAGSGISSPQDTSPSPFCLWLTLLHSQIIVEKQLFLNNYSVGRGGREGTGRQAGPSEFRPWALVVDRENQLWEVVR